MMISASRASPHLWQPAHLGGQRYRGAPLYEALELGNGEEHSPPDPNDAHLGHDQALERVEGDGEPIRGLDL